MEQPKSSSETWNVWLHNYLSTASLKDDLGNDLRVQMIPDPVEPWLKKDVICAITGISERSIERAVGQRHPQFQGFYRLSSFGWGASGGREGGVADEG